MPAAMARRERPLARPREISSRSANVSRKSEPPGGLGRRPALARTQVRIDPWARPMLRAIARIDSPRSSASQMSARSASENRRVISTSQSIQLPLINQVLR